ncbi:PAS domain-containing protein [Reichenbachiella ulvae]|uniref:histidine kinase n=1 Tax=Reichenbachiella ulvae TaxID=2980104 RepID=A0ABT3CNZ6_9BACT|nr:PAS domain-containing protein [Reichenbachiella ulvae]MCV9385194.1 PAS domain-containing protein [Reichenbachiella ulvae]
MKHYNSIQECIPEWLEKSQGTLIMVLNNEGNIEFLNQNLSSLFPSQSTLPTPINSLIQYPNIDGGKMVKLIRKNDYHLVMALNVDSETDKTPRWSKWDFSEVEIDNKHLLIGIGKEVKYFDLLGGKTISTSISNTISDSAILSVADQQGYIIMVNDNFCSFTKYTREELIGRRHREFIYDYHSKEFWKNMLYTLNEGKTWQDDIKVQAKDGQIYWFRTLVSPVFDESGNLFQILHIQFDITKHKLAEAEKLRLLRRYDNITSHLPGFAYQYKVNLDGMHYFPFVSEGMSKLLGLVQEEVRLDAQPFFNQIHEDDLQEVIQSKEQSAQSLAPWNVHFRMTNAEGQSIWVQNISTPERMIDGGIMWHGFCYDITEIKTSEETLAIQQQRLAEIAFIQSHEFRRPIANMLGIFDIMQVEADISESIPTKLGHWLNLLHESVKETDGIIAKIVTKAEEERLLKLKEENDSKESITPSTAPKC